MPNFADIMLPLVGAAITALSPRAGRGLAVGAGLSGQLARQKKKDALAAQNAEKVRTFKESMIPLLAGLKGPEGDAIRARFELDPQGSQGAASAAVAHQQRQQAQAAAAAEREAKANAPKPYVPAQSEEEFRSMMGMSPKQEEPRQLTDSQRFSLAARDYNLGIPGEKVREQYGFGEGTFPDGQSEVYLASQAKAQASAAKDQRKQQEKAQTKTEKELQALQKELEETAKKFQWSVEETSKTHSRAMYPPGEKPGKFATERYRKAKEQQFALWNKKRAVEAQIAKLTGQQRSAGPTPARRAPQTMQTSHAPTPAPAAASAAEKPPIAGRLVRNPKTGKLELAE